MTTTQLRDALNDDRLIGCQRCGLLGVHGCAHTTTDFEAQPTSITVPAHLFHALAPKPASRRFTIHIDSSTGQPLRRRL